MPGLFIVFEGIDGSGKSSMAEMARNYLLSDVRVPIQDVILTREPTNSSFGVKAKLLQKSEKDPLSNAEKCLDLYVSDRRHHLRFLIEPALQRNKVVLCDRYKYSTFVYQSLQGIDKSKIIKLHEGMEVPDLVLVFDVRAKIALSRMNFARRELEKFENEEFLDKASRAFTRLRLDFPRDNIHVIDGEQRKERVFAEVKRFIDEMI